MLQFAKRQIDLTLHVGLAFSIILVSNVLGLLKMKRDVVKVIIQGEFLAFVTVYDIAFGKDSNFFPIEMINNFRDKDGLQVSYYDQYYKLSIKDWKDLSEIEGIIREGGEFVLPDNMSIS